MISWQRNTMIKKGSSHLHTNTHGLGFWFIFYCLWQNTPCTLYFCTEGKGHYGLKWRNSCCLHPSSSKKECSATRALLSESPKSLVPFGLLCSIFQSEKTNRQTSPCASRQVWFSPCLQRSLALSECPLLHWAVCMPCVIYDHDLCPSAFTCHSWGRNQRNWGYCFSLRLFNGRETHLNLKFPLLFCLLLTPGLGISNLRGWNPSAERRPCC